MKKAFMGFIIGLAIITAAFILTVLIMASIHNNNFIAEIQSWFTKPVAPVPPVEGGATAIIQMLGL